MRFWKDSLSLTRLLLRFLSFFLSLSFFFKMLLSLARRCCVSFRSIGLRYPIHRWTGVSVLILRGRLRLPDSLSSRNPSVRPSLCWSATLSAAPACCFLSMFSRCLLLFRWPAARQPPTEPPSDPLRPADVDVKAAALTH